MMRHIEIRIRQMMRGDLSAVQEIENSSFSYPWTREKFELVAKGQSTVCLVAEMGSLPVGYMIYAFEHRCLTIENLAVDENHRREGVATALVAKAKARMNEKVSLIESMVSDVNYPAQSFFKREGFKAVKTLRNYYDVTDLDAYLFRFSKRPVSVQTRFHHSNRFSGISK